MDTLTPLTRYLGPYVTVCNYWNYSWTYLADHITDQDQTGQIQRIRAKMAGGDAGRARLTSAQALPDPGPARPALRRGGRRQRQRRLRAGPARLPDAPRRRARPDARARRRRRRRPAYQGPTFTGRAARARGPDLHAVAEGLPGIDPGTCGREQARMSPFTRRPDRARRRSSIGTYLGFTKKIPFRSHFEIKAAFQSSNNLKTELARAHRGRRGRQGVEGRADRPRARTRPSSRCGSRTTAGRSTRDATAKIRPRIFLEGNFFVDLTAGSPGAPELGDGDVDPRRRRPSTPVQLDEVLKALNAPTRARTCS